MFLQGWRLHAVPAKRVLMEYIMLLNLSAVTSSLVETHIDNSRAELVDMNSDVSASNIYTSTLGRCASISAVFTPGNTSKSASTSHTVLFAGSCKTSADRSEQRVEKTSVTGALSGEARDASRTVPLTMYADMIPSMHMDGTFIVVCCRAYRWSISNSLPRIIFAGQTGRTPNPFSRTNAASSPSNPATVCAPASGVIGSY